MPNQEPPLSALVAEAYGKLAGEDAPGSEPQIPNPVAAAFGAIAAEAEPKSPPNKTAQAYAQIPSSKALQRFDQLEAARGNTAGAFAGAPPRNVVFLMNTQSLPCKGMFSAPQPSALAPGQFSLLQDVRIDDRSIRARQPTTDRSAAGLPGTASSARGIWSGTLNGSVYVVGAWFDGTKVGLYSSTDGVAFTAVTQTSGAFGDSRMTDTGVPFAFQVVNNLGDDLDYLVIQNGTDAPRVYGPNVVNGSTVRIIKQFAAPLWASSTNVLSQCSGLWSANLAAVSSSGGAGHLSIALSGSAPAQTVAITAGTSTTSGDSVVLDFGSGGIDWTAGRQLLFVSDQAIMNAWNAWKVEGSTNLTTWITLSDPSSSTYYAPVRVPFSDPSFAGTSASGGLGGEEIVGFDTTVVSQSVISALRYVRLTWLGLAAPAASYTTTIHGILTSGSQLAFQQSYAVSYSGLAGMSESPGVLMAGFSAKSATQVSGFPQTVFFPYAGLLYYDHHITTQSPSLTDLQHGCDELLVYRKDQGSTDFFCFGSVALGSWSGTAWVFAGTGTTTPPVTAPALDIPGAAFNSTALNIARYVPDAYATVMPVGVSLASANGRTFVGGQSFYAVSEYGQAFRFRPALQFVNGAPLDRSATYVTIAGQTISAWATPSGSALNSQTVFFWTRTRTYACGGFDGYSLSRPALCFEIGCSAPGSVAQYKDAIFWLDDNLQIRKFNYGRSFLYGFSNANGYDLAPAISRMVVDDQTAAIPGPSLPWTKGVASFDCYYLFYTPAAGSTNTLALVFEENLQAFVQDSLSVGAQAVCTADLPSGRALILAGADGKLYTHEDPASSSPHPVRVTSGELSAEMWRPQFYGRVGLVADVQSGQSATITVTLKPSLTDISIVDLSTAATGQVWRWSTRSSSTQPGLHGLSAQVDLQFTMQANTRIYCLALETTPALPGPDQL